ncbi:MAG TPA: hypothetical protein PK385_10305 [Spirochaetota bacterium]|nr:hypothetical protein [Spirochaetota bacterium]HOS33198.1 hypothetical protein [Spirochaetota bacterium]HOS56438.1 hypothetical protein [Spirochaetota bacterium]HQF78280.1 hypothetical protein [Spirochaetota bacterium]HQH31226.1 hypothetical protein [Spirochaetota bacterium]
MLIDTMVPKEERIELIIPKKFLNKKIKIIISEASKSNYDDYFGIMNVNNIDEEIDKIRNEWDR